MRRINAAGLAKLKGFEALKLKAYRDGGGVWTIGWGHTGKDVHEGLEITPEQAEHLLMADLGYFEAGVDALTRDVPTTDGQFAAMVCLAFNIGLERFRNSTVLKRHKLGNRIGAANAFLLWKYDNGQLVEGLLRRREQERKMYLA
jgi:lysozyme